jgi:hypothetical protein
MQEWLRTLRSMHISIPQGEKELAFPPSSLGCVCFGEALLNAFVRAQGVIKHGSGMFPKSASKVSLL